MDPRDRVISSIADPECQRISRKVIRSLQGMTEGMQSGDDTCLKNLWDEVCVQVQGEESFIWDLYLDTIKSIITGYLPELDGALKQAIWLQTPNGMEWEPTEEEKEVPYSEDDISEHILSEYLLASAGSWSNDRIKTYIFET
jgi:hypothetical protein